MIEDRDQPRPQPLTVQQILAEGRQPRDPLVTQRPKLDSGKEPLEIIPKNSYTLLIAEAGHGKTWTALDLACHMVMPKTQEQSPRRWLGLYDVLPSRVLYMDEENGKPLIGKRLEQLGLPDNAEGLFVWCRSRLMLNNPSDIREITDFCKKEKCQVVFLDSLVRFHHSNENEAQPMAEVSAAIRRLVDHGLTVIALHHTNKLMKVSNDIKIRGSSEIMAGADTVLFLENIQSDLDRFKLSASKLRYASKDAFQTHYFRRQEEEGRYRFVFDGESKERPSQLDQKTSTGQKSQQLRGLILNRIRELNEAGKPTNVTSIRAGLGNTSAVTKTLDEMANEKTIVVTPKGNSKLYTIALTAAENLVPPSSREENGTKES